MKIRWTDLWQWEGRVDRGPYLVLGVLLFGLKYNLDRVVAAAFGRPWSPAAYLVPGGALAVTELDATSAPFYAALLAVALFFVWPGVALTLRRLRSASLPVWLVVLFFVPVVNLLFFLLLSILPDRGWGAEEVRSDGRAQAFLDRVIPDHPLGNAAMALLLPISLSALAAVFGADVLQQYGWGLFVGLPFVLGLASVLLYGYHRPRGYAACVAVATLSVGMLGVGLLMLAAEGAICLVMAAPLAWVLALMGASVGYILQRGRWRRGDAPVVMLVMMLAVPVLMGAEYAGSPRAPLFGVHTVVEIDATPEQVWQNVVTFSELPPPEDWLFRIGIAYPLRAEIRGHGPGAIRHCVFSTGPFVEPIQVWDQPRLLKFSVTRNPPPLEEWTPYAAIHPPHLEGFLVSRGGQFHLMELAGGRTRLVGTTWYHHHMWPATYWKGWADFIIHRIHLRVLRHVKRLSEGETRPA